MSRGQEGQIFDTATQQNTTAAGNAQKSFDQAQTGVQSYENQLSEFAAANPYKAGGEFQTSEDKALANTADATAQAAAQTLQGEAVRTGGNPAAAIAATEAMNQQNTRDLSAEQAKANADRISSEAGYGDKVLQASSLPATLETALTGQQLNAQDNTLNTAQDAAKTPSFLDTLGDSFAQGIGSGVGKWLGGAKMPCWIAARVFGGWGNRHTILFRTWLMEVFAKTWYGALLVRLYMRYGKWVAEWLMPRSRLADRFFSWLFHLGLARAEEWLATAPGARAYEAVLLEVL